MVRGLLLSRLLELVTGKDDLERVAARNDVARLDAYLKTRMVFVPIRPGRYLDPASFTEAELLELIEEEARELAKDTFDFWVFDVDGLRRLPAFSSRKKMQVFSETVSRRINKVFSLGCVECLLADVVRPLKVDVVDLNACDKTEWEVRFA